MKKNNINYAVLTLVILVVLIINTKLLTTTVNDTINLNPSINISSIMPYYNYNKMLEYLDVKYKFNDSISDDIRDYDYEKKLILFAKEVTEKLFDDSYSVNDIMNKYYIRAPFNIFGFSNSYYYSSYNKYLNDYEYLSNLKKSLIENHSSYSKIQDFKVYYGYLDYYVIRLSLSNVDNGGNKILEYKIIYEDSSDRLKVSDVLYFDENIIEEYKNTNSNVKRFSIVDYSDENSGHITDERALELKNKYFGSIVKIDVNNKLGENVDTVSGFFIDKNILVTTFDIFNNGLLNNYRYLIKDMNGTNFTFDGIVTFSKNRNIAIIKTIEEKGVPIKFNNLYDEMVVHSDVMISSIDGNIYIGQFLEDMYDNSYITRSNLPLNKNDRGSILINSYGNIIGINTWINTNSDVLLSNQFASIYSIYNAIKESDDEIRAINFDNLIVGAR